MLPIEIISHLARVLSLTVRLYANIFAGDLVTLAFFSLIPVGFPLSFSACTSWYRWSRHFYSWRWR
jgi:F-type H+-transporting ATPase subunit a